MLLVPKHGGKLEFLAKMFCMQLPSLECMIIPFIDILSELMHEHFFRYQSKKWKMNEMVRNNSQFYNYPMAPYATYVTIQRSFRPSESMEEEKHYFSGKKQGLWIQDRSTRLSVWICNWVQRI